MKRLKYLRVRFALWTAVLLLASMAVFGVFVYINLAHSLSSALNNSLRMSALQAAAAVNSENGRINFADSIPEGVTKNMVKHGLTIRIIDLRGNLVLAFGPDGTAPVDSNSVTEALNGQSTFGNYYDAKEKEHVRFYMTPILEDQRLVGVVQVMQDTESIGDTLKRLVAALLLAAPLLVGVSGLGGYFLAARALAPIDTMTQAARRISAEHLSTRLNLSRTDDEVGRLAATFDEMLTRLDNSFRRERQFTADASHELRTPVAAIRTILNVIREERRSPEDYEQALDDLIEETDRLQALTDGLMRLARGEDSQAAGIETVDLSALLLDVCDSLLPLAETKGLDLECAVENGLTLNADGDGLIHLFANLVDNAIKYTDQGKILISAGRNGIHSLYVTIKDTGCGIASEHLSRLFDRFYRVDPARASPGAGLGLAIASKIAHQNGATIEVSSQVNVGSTFTVWFNTRG